MKLKFDPNQEFQLKAIAAVVDLFEGQPDASQANVAFAESTPSSLRFSEYGVANQRVITDQQWLANAQAVQKRNDLEPSESLRLLKLEDDSVVGSFPNFTIEMETGTGKTYVYLRTIHELAQVYGFKKFVIVVPSVAIREGVLQTLKSTADHFSDLYGRPNVEFRAYESSKVDELRGFAASNAIQILVINIDAFATDTSDTEEGSRRKKGGNIINQVRETGVRPIEYIQSTNPIVILDEPQNLETDLRKQAIARLNPLCTLRYSATHRCSYNLLYSLDPVRAYELGLVKQISVDSVVEATDPNQAYIELHGFNRGKRSLSARLTIWANQANGPSKKTISIRLGDDLFEKSGNRFTYQDRFIVNEIDIEAGQVVFANGIRVQQGQPQGALTDKVLKLQIESTIRRHFEKALTLHRRGIKVLSVFFIDQVANYRSYDDHGNALPGKFAQWFEEIYEEYRNKNDFVGLMSHGAAEVHNGYFAQDKRAVTPFESLKESSNAEAEASAFELIMRDKERLLTLSEPLSFIFSHSALREGWDNPNVFQICTLAESHSDIKKRQEIGRGLRLCVNQNGDRVFDRNLNRLTIIANESYEDFAKQLQTEMADAGVRFKSDQIKREADKITLQLRKGYNADPQFLELWNRISRRTRYRVHYKTEDLIDKAATRIKTQLPTINRPRIAIFRSDLHISEKGVQGLQTGYRVQEVDARYAMPDLVGQVQSRTGLSRSTVAQILKQSERLEDALKNPQSFIDQVSTLINAVKRDFLVNGDNSPESGVKYVRVADSSYEMRRFEDDDLMEVFSANVRAATNKEKTLFSHIVIDSDSGPERAFAEACDNNDDVLFYIKLPRWFEIDTPVGAYTPDWAVAYKNDDVLYFVAETKGSGREGPIDRSLLRPIEELKLECGKRHFDAFEDVQFKVVRTLEALLE